MIGFGAESFDPKIGPAGRRGWLLVVAVGLVYTVFSVPVELVRDWLPWLLSPETSAMLADPEAYDYHPSLPAFLLFQIVITVLVGFAALVGLILFAQRSEFFRNS